MWKTNFGSRRSTTMGVWKRWPIFVRLIHVLILASLRTRPAHGIAPLDPDAPDYEDALQRHAMEEHEARMETKDIATELVHPLFCRQVPGEVCAEMERKFQDHGRNLALSVKEGRQVRALAILVRFSNHLDRYLPLKDVYEELFNGEGHPANAIINTMSVREWLHDQSQHRLTVQTDVLDWATTNNTEQFFAGGVRGIRHEVRHALDHILEKLDDEGFDFGRYDGDGDGVMDMIYLIHSGFPAELSGTDCYGTHYTDRIWAHAIQHPGSWTSKQEAKISTGPYVVASGVRSRCGGQPARIGTITHESLHLFGLPDLYGVADEDGSWVGRGAGHFDVMSDGSGRNADGSYIPSLSAWSRFKLGWLTPKFITTDGYYELNPIQTSNEAYMIYKGFPEGEYLLIENRQPIGTDRLLWGGGILIWHVDTYAWGQRFRGHPGMPGWPGNGHHYSVALVQADGKFDLEAGANAGDGGDFWTSRSWGIDLTPGVVEDEASDPSNYPNSNAYQNGQIARTGIHLYLFSKSQDTMSFRVSGLGTSDNIFENTTSPSTPPQAAPTSVPTRFPTRFPTPFPTRFPTPFPTRFPTPFPTRFPTPFPTREPTRFPTREPTRFPTREPTRFPTRFPTTSPTSFPTTSPTSFPTRLPTNQPTRLPTRKPSPLPTRFPSLLPSFQPTFKDTHRPSEMPSAYPSSVPSVVPSSVPSTMPSNVPSEMPSSPPSLMFGVPSPEASVLWNDGQGRTIDRFPPPQEAGPPPPTSSPPSSSAATARRFLAASPRHSRRRSCRRYNRGWCSIMLANDTVIGALLSAAALLVMGWSPTTFL